MAASVHSDGQDYDDDDFVDARETMGPPSPVRKKSASRAKESGLVIEELTIENVGLKRAVDQITKRLLAFEASAQSSSHALNQSMRLMRPSSPAPSVPGTGAKDSKAVALLEKIAGLEHESDKARRDIERLSRENEKLKSVVSRYRERWEKLKEGAKSRREGAATAGKDADLPRFMTG